MNQAVNHTEIVCVIDESGSMGSLTQQTIDGFNKFVEEQRQAPGTANLTLITFNTGWKTPIKRQSIATVPQLDRMMYGPNGGTALLDALGHAIDNVGKVLMQPGTDVVFVVITDGQENSSTDYKLAQVKEMIEGREKDGWKFIYLGANQDAFSTAASMGMNAATSVNYAANAVGTASTYGYASDTVAMLREAKASGATLTSDTTEAIVNATKQKWQKKLEGDDTPETV